MAEVLFWLLVFGGVVLFLFVINRMMTFSDDGLSDAQRSQLRHYCPQCGELEENCECAMC